PRQDTNRAVEDIPAPALGGGVSAPEAQPFTTDCPCSPTQHNVFTSATCSTVLHFTSSSRGLATSTERQRAREIATFRRLRLKRNSMCRGISSCPEVVIEISTTAASWPWNLSTVPTRARSGSIERRRFTWT